MASDLGNIVDFALEVGRGVWVLIALLLVVGFMSSTSESIDHPDEPPPPEG